jgi:hypothetical protein
VNEVVRLLALQDRAQSLDVEQIDGITPGHRREPGRRTLSVDGDDFHLGPARVLPHEIGADEAEASCDEYLHPMVIP